VEAGGILRGTLSWQSDDGRTARYIIAAAEWLTEGSGNVASGVGRSKKFAIPPGQREAAFPFRFLIPYEGPVSFAGEHITVKWKLRARVDLRGFDEFAEDEFTVTVRK
jgi:hypothetical protein